MGQDSQTHYWLRIVVQNITIGSKTVSYSWFIVLFPFVIPLGHLLIALTNGSLHLFLSDAGIYLTIIAWIAILASIEMYTKNLGKFTNYLEQNFNYDNAKRKNIENAVLGKKWMIISGIGVALIELLLIFFAYHPGQFVTGFKELPYHGSFALSVRYSSIPAYLWTNFFWCFYSFILGNCLWIFGSTIFVISRNPDRKVASRGNEQQPTTGLVTFARKLLFSSLANLGLPIVILSPIAVTDITNQSLLPKLAQIYEIGSAVFVVFLVATLLVYVLVVHKTANKR